MTATWTIHESALLGPLTLVGGRQGLSRLLFPGREPQPNEAEYDPTGLADATRQLEEYLTGSRQSFELTLDIQGTPFQRSVWDQLLRIPYGETVSYTELAGLIGRADRVRAVGGAVARTPVPIVIPCHRVVGVNGALTGYGGGLERKAALLSLEQS
jgi:methylated-DNA-[protein]-cysteine S-methyltransferase